MRRHSNFGEELKMRSISLQIGFWGIMNPRLWEKPKDLLGKITKSAGYQNPETELTTLKNDKFVNHNPEATDIENKVGELMWENGVYLEGKIPEG